MSMTCCVVVGGWLFWEAQVEGGGEREGNGVRDVCESVDETTNPPRNTIYSHMHNHGRVLFEC